MSKNEAKIALFIDQARTELDKIDNQAVGAKTRIVQDLAEKLRPLLPHEEIAEEIVVKLKGKVGKTLVYKALGDEYKNKNRVKAQKKPKKKNLSSLANLAQANLSISTPKLVTVSATGHEEINDDEPEGAVQQWQKLKQEQEQKDKENDEYVHYLKEQLATKDAKIAEQAQEIKELKQEIEHLKQPFDAPTIIDFAGKRLKGASAHVRPAHHEVPIVTVPEAVIPAGAF